MKKIKIQWSKLRLNYTHILMLFLLMFFNVDGNTQTVLPSNTGTLGGNMAPVGWTIIMGTTDNCNTMQYFSSSSYSGGPMPAAPNGDTQWIGGHLEEVGTTVSGIVSGSTYTITFHTFTAFESAGGPRPLEVLIDGNVIQSVTHPVIQNWYTHQLVFTATSSTALLSFKGTDTSYYWCLAIGGAGAVSGSMEICDNGIDDDEDGLTDCDDTDDCSCCGTELTGVALSVTNADPEFSTAFAYTDMFGEILGTSDVSPMTNIMPGTWDFYVIQYKTSNGLPSTWMKGTNVAATMTDGCVQVVGPEEITISCCSDAILAIQKLEFPGCPNNMTVDIKVLNGDGALPVGTPITFYEGDPTAPGANQLNTYLTTMDIAANSIHRINDIDIGECANMGIDIYAIIGEDGTSNLPLDLATDVDNPVYEDCDTSNNMSLIELKIPCGRYVTIE